MDEETSADVVDMTDDVVRTQHAYAHSNNNVNC